MKQEEDMSLDECRDFIARAMGWTHVPHFGQAGPVWKHPNGRVRSHAVPATLDAAAASLPEGWHWAQIGPYWERVPGSIDPPLFRDGRWFAIVCDAEGLQQYQCVGGPCESELLARFRAAAAAWQRVLAVAALSPVETRLGEPGHPAGHPEGGA